MKPSILLILMVTLSTGCATPENALRERQLAQLQVEAERGNPLAARDLALAIATNGEGIGSFSEALRYAKYAQDSKIPGSAVLYARLLEATLKNQDAYTHYLAVASNNENALIYRAQSLIRLQGLMDLVWVQASDVKRLLSLAQQEGLGGELAALAAEQGAIRLGSDKDLRLARQALGVVTAYRRSSRINSLAARPIHPRKRNVSEHANDVDLGEPIACVDGNLSFGEEGSGVYSAEINLPTSSLSRELRVEKVEQLVIRLNGKEIRRINRLAEPGSDIVRVALPPDSGGTLRLWIGSRAPAPRVRVSIRPGRTQSLGQTSIRSLELLAELDLALHEANVDRAVQATREFLTLPPVASIAITRLQELDPGFSIAQNGRGARELLARALELAPSSHEVRRALVLELASGGETAEADAVLRKMPTKPLDLKVLRALETHDNRSARRLSDQLVSQTPTSCTAHTMFMSAHGERLRFDKSDWYSKLPFCGATQLRAAEILQSGWRNRDAVTLLKKHMTRSSRGVQRARAMLLLGRLYRSLGQNKTAEDLLRAGIKEGILVREFLDGLSRLRTLAQDHGEADAINARLVQRGSADLELSRSRFDPTVDLGLPLEDGLTLARKAVETRNRELQDGREQPSIRIIFKERHTRVLADGSMVHREHQLAELLDDGAIERFGEIPLPENAQVLVARTYKPTPNGDLQPIEPEQMNEKTSLSLPALTPGSIIETAWLWQSSPADPSDTHWLMPHFNFDDLHGPVKEARFILRTPLGSAPKVKAYGRSPRREELEPGLTRFSLSDVHRARKEPLDPRSDLHRNTLVATSATTVEHLRTLLVDRLSEKRKLLPSVRKWAVNQVKGLSEPREQLRALYRGTINHVLDSDLNIFRASVAQTLRNRSGNRSVVLRSACEAVGLNCSLVMLEPRYSQDPSGDELAYAGRFFYPVVRAVLSSGEIWLDPNRTHAPFGYLVPLARGGRGLVLEEDQPTLTKTPSTIPKDGLRQVTCEGIVAHDSKLTVDCQETLTGHHAIDRRSKLSSYDAATRVQYVGVFAKRIFPSSRIHTTLIKHLDSPEKPLILKWSADTNLTKEDTNEFMLRVGLSPTYLTRMTVRIPTRTAPLFTMLQFDVDFTLRLRTEGLYRFAHASKKDTVDHGMLQLERIFEVDEKQQNMTVRKRFHLDVGRVLPQDYRRWVDTARRVDKLERVRIMIER